MKWLGLTGGIACGKSTVSRALREKGIPVLDADEVAKEVVLVGSPGLRSIVQEFGSEVLLPDGSLDRRKLGQIVFEKADLLSRLESILHPLIQAETLRLRRDLEARGESIAIYDIPLLFETHAEDQFDFVIVVTCTLDQQKERLRLRNGLSENEIAARIASQIPLKFKEQSADFVLHNDQNELHLTQEIERLWQWLQKIKDARN